MVQIIEWLPQHVLAFRLSGAVSGEDYERTIMPALESMARLQGEIYFLMVIDTAISEFTLSALWDDLKAGFKHFSKWKKIAVVSENRFYDTLFDLITYIIPGKTKGFTPDQLEEAKQWVSEKI